MWEEDWIILFMIYPISIENVTGLQSFTATACFGFRVVLKVGVILTEKRKSPSVPSEGGIFSQTEEAAFLVLLPTDDIWRVCGEKRNKLKQETWVNKRLLWGTINLKGFTAMYSDKLVDVIDPILGTLTPIDLIWRRGFCQQFQFIKSTPRSQNNLVILLEPVQNPDGLGYGRALASPAHPRS